MAKKKADAPKVEEQQQTEETTSQSGPGDTGSSSGQQEGHYQRQDREAKEREAGQKED